MRPAVAAACIITGTILGILAVYLLGAFYAASFDISTWSDAVRFLVAIGLCGGAAGGFVAGCWVVSL